MTKSLRRNPDLDADTLIVSSDFRRARESAEIAHGVLGCNAPVYFDERLRERFFGDFELTPDSGYTEVWYEDDRDPDHGMRNVESPNRVMARVTALIAEYESKYSSASILLVSHGDALQLLQTAFARQKASQHRRLQHLKTAEIRELILSRVPHSSL